ncbi:MAG: hypothetical protein IANPNBLG_00186 [Bryobacteraceae bacterium]|nr:hypothetical protein [Bryobacteraceae bacterium]
MSDLKEPPDGSVTELLNRWSAGDRAALDDLMPLIYRKLHKLASRQLASHGSNHTLQATALLHETYVHLAGSPGTDWRDRNHFLCAVSKAMRHILVDYARRRRAAKRGGMLQIVPIQEGIDSASEYSQDILALNDGLALLEASFPRPAKVLELRYFGGLAMEEVALALQISPETAGRDCRFARSFLRQELSQGQSQARL